MWDVGNRETVGLHSIQVERINRKTGSEEKTVIQAADIRKPY